MRWSEKRKRVVYLQEQGFSLADIAKDVKLSERHVSGILCNEIAGASSKTYSRCAGCGSMVKTPCLICAAREGKGRP